MYSRVRNESAQQVARVDQEARQQRGGEQLEVQQLRVEEAIGAARRRVVEQEHVAAGTQHELLELRACDRAQAECTGRERRRRPQHWAAHGAVAITVTRRHRRLLPVLQPLSS